jgi:adenosylcobinamide-phosphate synthase
VFGAAASRAQMPDLGAPIERAAAGLERRLNRQNRDERVRASRGAAAAAALIAAAAGIGWGLSILTHAVSWGWIVQLLLVALLLGQRPAYRDAAEFTHALDVGDTPAARAVLRRRGRPADATLDDASLARGAIEQLFQDFARGVAAVAFWYLIAGLPGLFAARAARTLRATIGGVDPRQVAFGRAARAFDQAFTWIPARLGAGLVALAAAIAPTAAPGSAWRAFTVGPIGSDATPTEAAAAGALGLMLGGPRWRDGALADDPWLGVGRLRAAPSDVRRALVLFSVACLVTYGVIGGIALVIGRMA